MNSTQTDVDIVASTKRSSHPVRLWFQGGYLCVALFFVLCVIIQVFLAGAGILVTGYWLAFHKAFGHIIIFIPILLLPLGLSGHLSRTINWLSALLAVLALLQPVLIMPMRDLGLPMVAALHPVNALIIFALPLFLSYRVWRFMHDERNYEQQ